MKKYVILLARLRSGIPCGRDQQQIIGVNLVNGAPDLLGEELILESLRLLHVESREARGAEIRLLAEQLLTAERIGLALD